MAEEEILTEHVVAPKKAKEGGFNPIILIVVIVAALVIFAGIIIKLVPSSIQKSMDPKFGGIEQQLSNKEAIMKGMLAIEECGKETKAKIVSLTPKEPLVLNLADGHYVRTNLSVCVDTAVLDEDVKAEVDQLVFVVTEVFNRKTVKDIVNDPTATTPAETKKPASGESDMTNMLGSEGESTEATPAGKSKLNALRVEILTTFGQFKSLKIKDVYMPGLVVDVGK